MQMTTRVEEWPLRAPFSIARETIHEVPVLVVSVEDDGAVGHGEAVGVDYRGETPDLLAAQVEAFLASRSAFPKRDELLSALPPGGARNALDCALLDWEAKTSGMRAWDVLGLGAPRPLPTVFTISLAAPEAMAEAALDAPGGATLKLKLGGRDGADVARVGAVRQAMQSASLIVDVNEGWSLDDLNQAAPALADLGIRLIEQPLPAGEDRELDGYSGPVPLCADEGFDELASFATLAPAYSMINIKLDKCGGLTAGLLCKAEAERRGLEVFVGSMLGTSLGCAPAFLLGQGAAFVDLDGPLLLERDRQPSIAYDDAVMAPFPAQVWG